MLDAERVKEIEEIKNFQVNDNPDLEFQIEINSDSWTVFYVSREKPKKFFTITKEEYDENVLFNNRSNKFQLIKNKFIYYCKSFAQFKEKNNQEEYFNDFIDYLRWALPKIPLKESSKSKSKDAEDTDKIPKKYLKKTVEFLESEGKFKVLKKLLDFRIEGEDDNKVLLVLLLSGAYFGIYQIVLVIGDSTSGKSFIVNEAVSLFPDKHIYSITGASDKAIIYKNWGEVKIFYISEINRNLDLAERLKDFGDRGIVYIVVEKDPLTNKYETKEYIIGKLSVVGTTTKEGLNVELENRAWKLEPDISKKQSESITKRTLKLVGNRKEESREEKQFKELERILKYSFLTLEKEYDFDEIEIPYAHCLEPLFNYRYTKIRRDHTKFLELIMIISSWNYKSREYYEYNNRKILLSHPNDLDGALEIGSEIFENISRNLSVEKRNILECLIKLLEENDKQDYGRGRIDGSGKEKTKKWFLTNEIYKYYCEQEGYNKSKRSFINLLKALSFDGYLLFKKKGVSNAYKLEKTPLINPINIKSIKKESIERYRMKRDDLIIDKEIKFYENEKLIEKMPKYSIEIKKRIDELFKTNKETIGKGERNSLFIENIVQILSLDGYSEEILVENIKNMVNLTFYDINSSEDELMVLR